MERDVKHNGLYRNNTLLGRKFCSAKDRVSKIFTYVHWGHIWKHPTLMFRRVLILPLCKSCIYKRKYQAALFRNIFNKRSKQIK